MKTSREAMYEELLLLRRENYLYKKMHNHICFGLLYLKDNNEGKYISENEYFPADGFKKMGFADEDLAELTKQFILQLCEKDDADARPFSKNMPHEKHKKVTSFARNIYLKLKNKDEIKILAHWRHLPNTRGDKLCPLLCYLYPIKPGFTKDTFVMAIVDEFRKQNRNELIDLLSEQEEKVIRLSIEGYTSEEVAKEMKIRKSSVTTYKSRIMAKTGARKFIAVLCRYLAMED